MLGEQHQRFSKEVKLEAVRLLEAGEKPAAEIALEFAIRRNQLRDKGEAAFGW